MSHLLSRRDAGKLMLAGCASALAPAGELWSVTKINSEVRGVQIGAQAWSFRDRPLDACIAAYREVGLGECELSDVHFNNPNPPGPDLDPKRLDTPLSIYHDVRRKFDAAGVQSFRVWKQFSRGLFRPGDRAEFSNNPGDGAGLHHHLHQNLHGAPHR